MDFKWIQLYAIGAKLYFNFKFNKRHHYVQYCNWSDFVLNNVCPLYVYT